MYKGIDILKMAKKPLESDYSEYEKYNGQDFEIVRELEYKNGTACEIDEEVAPMYLIKMSDGTELNAYPEEIFTDESLNTVLLEKLQSLVEAESQCQLTEDESSMYCEIVDMLKRSNVEIPFGINI